MKKKLFALLLLSLSVCWVSGQIPAAPQGHDHWEFSFFAGWNFPSSPKTFVTPVNDGSSNLVRVNQEGSYTFGFSVIENMGKRFGAELDYTASRLTSEFLDLGTEIPNFEMSQFAHNLAYSGVIYLTDRGSKIRPYGSVGAGVSLFHVSSDSKNEGATYGMDIRDEWKFAFKYGGGLKWELNPKWAVRFDFRDTLTGVPNYGLPRTAQNIGGAILPAFRPEGNLHMFQFTAGIVYRFRP